MQRFFPAFLAVVCLLPACGAQVLDVGATDRGSSNDPSDPAAGPGASSGAGDDSSWFPTTACTPVGQAPKLVLDRRYLSARGLVADGATLYFEGNDTETLSSGVRGVYSLTLSGTNAGIATKVDLAGASGRFTLHGDALAFVRVLDPGGTNEENPRKEAIVLRDRKSGAETVLANPRSTTYVNAMLPHASGLYWTSREYRADKPASIVRMAPGATSGVELATIDNATGLVADGHDVFYVRWVRDELGKHEIRIEAVPADGGTPRVLRRMAYDSRKFWSLVGVDTKELYFTEENTDASGTIGAGSVVAIPKDASDLLGGRIVVEGQRFSGSPVLDPDYVTWIDQEAQAVIRRVPRSGGAVQRLAGTEDSLRYVQGLTVDRCNVYWSVVNPPAIYAVNRIPPR